MASTRKKQKFASIVRNELSRAESRDAHDVGANRASALSAYRLAPLEGDDDRLDNGQAIDQSADVADMVNACLAQMTPMLTTDCAIQFEPEGAQDEDSARAESQAVDNVIQSDNAGYVTFSTAFHDALLLRNGWTKVFVEDDIEVREMALEGDETAEEMNILMTPKHPGETREMINDGLGIRITTTRKRFRCCAVPTENITYNANEDSNDVDELRFIAERMILTRSELVEMGYSKREVYALNQTTDETNIQSRYRNKSSEETHIGETPDQEAIQCHECYLKVDMDNDGVAELYRVFTAGDEGQVCLGYERAELVPYATGSPFISPHRITGESLFDRLWQIQISKTKILRYSLDEMQKNTYGRFVVDETQTRMDDVLNWSGVIRSQNPTQAVIPVAQHNSDAQFQTALEYQDKLRSERGGAALDMQAAEMQIHGETAHGIERQVSLREMLTAMMARNLGETLVRRTYRLMHDFLRMYSNSPMEMKLNGEWQTVDPRQWRKRTRMNIKVGLSAGEKSRKTAALNQMIQMQIGMLTNGKDGILTDEGSLYNAMADWAYASDLDNPDSYLVNPASEQAMQTKQQRAQQGQQMQQIQMQLTQMQAKQLENAEKIKGEIELLKHRDEMAYKYWSDRLKSETEEAKVVATATTDLTKAQLEGERRERAQQRGADEGAARNGGVTE